MASRVDLHRENPSSAPSDGTEGGGLGAIGGALFSLGIPEDSVLQYEAALKADSFLLVAHGPTDEMARAKTVLDSASPTRIDLHRDVNDMPELTPNLFTRNAVSA